MKRVAIGLLLVAGCSASNSDVAKKHIQIAQDCIRTAEIVCQMSGDPMCVRDYLSRADAACEIAKKVVDLVEKKEKDGGTDATGDAK